MNKIYSKLLLGLFLVLGTLGAGAQVAVTVTNPTNTTPNLASSYTSLANAITALNTITGISGSITLTCAAGNETAPAGGYSISFTAPTTATNNVIITGTTTTTITTSSALTAGNLNDAVFKIIGTSFITIQNFSMQENAANTTTAAATNNMTEWGVALLYSSLTVGSQNNIIQNNIISLNRTYLNTFGIYSNTRHSATAVTTTAEVTSASGSNSGNKVYGNAISNVNFGIVFIGAGTTLAAIDNGNDIGGSSAITGNTITNWGGGAALSSYVSLTANNYCIFDNQQINDNISFNTITSAASLASAVTEGGILKNYSVASPTSGTITTTINSNTVSVSNAPSAATTGGIIGINNQGLTPLLATATMSMNSNTVQNCVLSGSTSTTNGISGVTNLSLVGTINILTNNVLNNSITASTSTSGSFTAISNTGAAGTLNINNNIIRGYSNSSTAVVSGGYLAISNSGAVATAININSNQIGNASGNALTFPVATSGICNGIQNTGGASTCTLTINGNSFKGFSFVSAGSVSAILNTSGFVGGNISINNTTTDANFISYSAANSSALNGISNAGGSSSTVLTITGNDIRGITHTVAGSSAHTYIINSFATLSQNISTNTFTNLNVNTTGSVTFISNNVALPATGTCTVNGNSIVTAFNKGGAGGTVTGYLTTTSPSSLTGSTKSEQNNNFSNVTVTGATIVNIWTDLEGSPGPAKTISGNTFNNWTCGSGTVTGIQTNYSGTGSTISNNSITNISGTGVITGISRGASGGNGAESITGNTITSLTSSGTGGSVIAITGGYSGITVHTISNNIINTLSSSGASSTIAGIQSTAGTTVNITGNTINTLSGSGASSPVINGISVSAGTTVNVSKNKIYDVSQSGAISTTSPAINGLLLSGGTTVNAYNNLIGDLRTPAASLADAIRGISVTSSTASTTYNVYYNTVNLAATSTGAIFGTSGLFHTISSTSTTAKLDLRNNIIVNTSTPNTTGSTVVFRRSGGAANNLVNYASTSNYNDFFAGTPSASQLLYSDGTSSAQTIASYKNGVFLAGTIAPRDAASISENPGFQSTVGSSSSFLKYDVGSPKQIESGAANISTYTDDYLGTIRQGNAGYSGTGTAPDMGAWELNGIATDLTPPTITYTPLNNTLCNSNVTLSPVTITDASSVNTTTGTKPRIYFKKSTNANSLGATNDNTTDGWKFKESSSSASPFSFTIDYTMVFGGVASGETVQYFITAQDLATTPNVGINTGIFNATPTSVALTAAAFPITGTINSYTLLSGALSSDVTIGASGTYTTLSGASGLFAALNAGGLTANINATIVDASVPETGAIALNAINYGCAGTYTLTIKPAVGVNATLTGNSATALIKLNGADNVIIDGSNNGTSSKNLTITNTNTATSGNGVIWLASASASDGATNNTIKNCIISGNASTTTLTGIFSGGTSSIAISSNSLTPNFNNTIQNNTISKAQYGIFAIDVSTTTLGTGLVISNNALGSAAVGDGFSTGGIVIQNQSGAIISGNSVQNVKGAGGLADLSASSTTVLTDIYLRQCKLSTVSKNAVFNSSYTGTNTYRQYGISIESPAFNVVGTPSQNTIVDNTVYSINYAGGGSTWTISGINLNGGYGDKLYYNTVYLSGTVSTSAGPAAAFSNGNASNTVPTNSIDVRDNIFYINGTSTVSATYFSEYNKLTTGTGSTLNYNDLFVVASGSATAQFGYFNGSNVANLSAWQTATGQEANSISVDPLLNGPANVSPSLGSPVINVGTAASPGPGDYPTDFAGTTRSGNTTLGAYETASDALPPAITYTALGNTTSTANRSTSSFATITDASGVNTTTGTKPRIYYKKSSDVNNTFNDNTAATAGWKYAESTSSSSPFDFTIDYSLLSNGPVVAGDVIQYFVVAQDLASTPNVGINSGTFNTTPTSVALAASAFPIGGTINSYTITPSISGIKTVCPSGCDYTSLTLASGAFATINSGTVTGNVTLQIAGDLTAETGLNSLNEFASPYTVTIKPTGAARAITGTSAAGLITLNAADRVTIDGSLGITSNTVCPASSASRDLTITNTNTGTSSAVVWLQSVGANGATNNTIQNCNIVGSGVAQTLIGIGSGSSTISTTSLGTGNNNNSIINNNISGVQFGIYSQGASAANKNVGTTINQNNITASPNTKGGIWASFENNITISGNSISNVATTSSINAFGITCGFGTSMTSTTSAGNEVTNATITKNIIGSVTNSNTYSAFGIGVSAATSGTTLISNNMIYGVASNGTGGDISGGIILGGGTGSTTNVYFNTVSMQGTIPGSTGASQTSACLIVTNSTAPTLDLRNNIFSNTQVGNTGATVRFASIALGYSSFTTLTSNNNDLYCAGAGPGTYQIGITGTVVAGTNSTLLSDWQTTTSKDANSVSLLPTFISATDLHINPSDPANTPLHASAASGTGITNDIDCDVRGTTPDIGADQFIASTQRPGYWTGATSTTWTTATNWEDNTVPASGADINIPTRVTNNPVLVDTRIIGALSLGASSTLGLNDQSLTINGAVSGTGALKGTATAGASASNIIITGAAGTLIFDQTSLPSSAGLNNLTLNNASSAMLGSALNIYGTLTLTTATLDANGQNVTMKSTAAGTSQVSNLTGSNLSNATNFTVERYIPNDSRRAFRLLSVPTITTNTANAAWMNGQTPGTAGPAGLGTWITGPIASSSTTFDFKTGNGGMFKGYNGSAYVSVTRTDTSINTDKGFLLFVRGDRTLNTTNTGSNSTTLKSTGTLKQGSYPTTAIPVAAASFEIVGNPYASQVNMKNVTMGADPKFYIFDPKLGTTGGYQTCSSTGPGTDYTITPGGGSYGPNGSVMDTVQSGQAFFVYSTAGTANATTFAETNKSTGSSNGGFSPLSLSERLITNLYSVNNSINSLADGTTTDFGVTFSNAVDMYDAIKLNNFGLNLGMTRSGYNLAVERKQPIGTTDTVFYNLTGAAQQQYQFEFIATQLNHPNLFGFLQDSYLNTSTPINLDGTTTVNFTIDGNAASAAANRFRIVFGPVSALPVTFSNVKAYSQGSNIAVEWSVENERNMRHYEVEKSTDGSVFTRTTTVTALNTNSSNYNWLDVHAVAGYNYYRIRSTDINGNIKYSVIVKVLVGSGKQDIVIYPNPVIDGRINLQLNNMPGGTYSLRLINSLGQSVFSKLIQHADGSSTESVNLSSGLAKGIYQLEVTKPDHSRIVKQVNY